MNNETPIEQRLSAVENAVRELQRHTLVQPPASDWLEQISGSFKDEPAFDEVLEYGRRWRASGQPSAVVPAEVEQAA